MWWEIKGVLSHVHLMRRVLMKKEGIRLLPEGANAEKIGIKTEKLREAKADARREGYSRGSS